MNRIQRPILRSIRQWCAAGVFLASTLLPTTARADAAALLSALNELKSHINGTITLSAAGISDHKLTIDANAASYTSSSAIIAASLDLVKTYDAVLARCGSPARCLPGIR